MSLDSRSGRYVDSIDTGRAHLLLQEQERLLADNRENGQRWTKLQQDYENLNERLLTIGDQPTQTVMVPLGKKAFVPGKLIHTNEIMVLLGDNWFAERSAKQAREVAQRRLVQCRDTLDKYEQEKELVENWNKQTLRLGREENEGTLDIKEPYDEEAEKKWRSEHKLKLREHMKKEKEGSANLKDDEDEELWRRLDELELEEQLDGYLEYERDQAHQEEEEIQEEGHDNESHESIVEIDKNFKRKVSFGDIQIANVDNATEENKNVIKVTHRNPPETPVQKHQDELENYDLKFLAPNDLEKQFCSKRATQELSQSPPKSILKPFDPRSLRVHGDDDDDEEYKEKPVKSFRRNCEQIPVDAVKDVVVERSNPGVVVEPVAYEETRKISKFKVSRMKL